MHDDSTLPTKILVVDDRPENLLTMKTLLDFPEVEVLTSSDGQSALSLILEHEFALALLDVQMPEINGFELARLMRGSIRSRHIPIIFVTANQPARGLTFEGYEKGAVDFLYKPVDAHIVRNKVRVFVELDQNRKTLLRLKEKAEQDSRAKSRYLAHLSHEIRTPLSAVVGYAELLAQGSSSGEDRQEYADAIMRNGQILSQLIDNVLDLSKIEAGELLLESHTISLPELLDEVRQTWSYKCLEKGLTFEVSADSEVPSLIVSDIGKVRQILANLLGNAFKFTQQGSVHLTVSSVDREAGPGLVAFTVSDTGCGLTAEAAARLFRPFAQGEISTARVFGGTGLGLTISRELARALGGDLVIASSQPGGGAKFVATIYPGAAEAPLSSPEEAGDWNNESKFSTDEPALSLSGYRVLVAEDHPDLRQLLSSLLKAEGAKVSVAETGSEALRYLEGNPVDLLLLDIHMPDLDGFQTALQLRTSGFKAPIVALTAAAMTEDRVRCLEAGCNDYLSKPVQREVLLRTIQRTLQAHRKGQSVMVVEDNPLAAAALKALIQSLECRVQVAATGQHALALTRDCQFDLILVDLELPDMPGLELLDFLEEVRKPNTIIAAHTGHSPDEVGSSPAGHRFEAFLRKPTNLSVLSRLLTRSSGSSQLILAS